MVKDNVFHKENGECNLEITLPKEDCITVCCIDGVWALDMHSVYSKLQARQAVYTNAVLHVGDMGSSG